MFKCGHVANLVFWREYILEILDDNSRRLGSIRDEINKVFIGRRNIIFDNDCDSETHNPVKTLILLMRLKFRNSKQLCQK